MTAPAQPVRTRILDAAEALVHELGVARLTLEATARAAGVSKGGLLYHVASKEALLAGMMARLATAISEDFDQGVAAQAPGPGRVARAMLDWALSPHGMANEHLDRTIAVFLSAHHHDTALLAPVRAVIERFREQIIHDGLPAGHGAAIMAATDGLMMARMFGLYSLTDAQRQAMHAALSRLLETSA